MGSSFGKVRKYTLNPVEDPATPLKYSSVPEDHVQPPVDSPLHKQIQKHAPDDKQTIKPLVEPFVEKTPNYGQLLPDHLRYNVDGMFIGRTTSSTGHMFSAKSHERSHSPTLSFKEPQTNQFHDIKHTNKQGSFESTEHRLKPKQKYYSADDLHTLLTRMKSHTLHHPGSKEDTPRYSETTVSSHRQQNEPCKYCKGFNPPEYRGQYIIEPEPPPYRSTSSATAGPRLGEYFPLDYAPTGKHYHILEVHPQPYFTSEDPRPLHDYGRYNMWEDTSRPNLMEDPTQVPDNTALKTDINAKGKHEGVQGHRSSNNIPGNYPTSSVPHYQNPAIRNTPSPSQRYSSRPSVSTPPVASEEIKTSTLPCRSSSHHCYTIPEENVWPPPFHHSRPFQQVNRGGFRK